MPPVKREYESGLDYVGRGFWFAIGFTPVFIALSALSTLLYMYFVALGLQVSFDSAFNHSLPPVHHSVESPSRQSMSIETSNMTPEQQQERECSRLMLRYSETQDPDVKKKMYDVCPE